MAVLARSNVFASWDESDQPYLISPKTFWSEGFCSMHQRLDIWPTSRLAVEYSFNPSLACSFLDCQHDSWLQNWQEDAYIYRRMLASHGPEESMQAHTWAPQDCSKNCDPEILLCCSRRCIFPIRSLTKHASSNRLHEQNCRYLPVSQQKMQRIFSCTDRFAKVIHLHGWNCEGH